MDHDEQSAQRLATGQGHLRRVRRLSSSAPPDLDVAEDRMPGHDDRRRATSSRATGPPGRCGCAAPFIFARPWVPGRRPPPRRQPSPTSCPRPGAGHAGPGGPFGRQRARPHLAEQAIRRNLSAHLTTAKDGRAGAWAATSNAEIAYGPTNASWLNRSCRSSPQGLHPELSFRRDPATECSQNNWRVATGLGLALVPSPWSILSEADPFNARRRGRRSAWLPGAATGRWGVHPATLTPAANRAGRRKSA